MSSDLKGLPQELLVEDLDTYRDDWWAHSLMRRRAGSPKAAPLGAARPRSVEDVALVLRWASERSIPVVPRGGGSGVCGGAEPGASALVLDLSDMSSILSLDPDSQVVRAQAGISGPDLEAALGEEGLTLGHWPQSFYLSTLGGWISTKAAGQMSTLYGNIEDRILGLTAVLPDGTVVASKSPPRSAVGPDWWRLFIGAEGTLGVVTDAAVSVFRVPRSVLWMGLTFEDFDRGLHVMRLIMQAGIRPAVLRLYDQADAAINLANAGPMAIARFEGTAAMVQAQVEDVARVASTAGATVTGPEDGEKWWEHRFDAAATYKKLLAGDGPLGRFAVLDTMEVSASWTELPEVYRSVRSALEAEGAAAMAHASHMYTTGSGLYFTFFAETGSDDAAEGLYDRCWERATHAAMVSGASISHHHGIGLLRSRWARQEMGTGYEALRRIKTAFDPAGTMNPGKAGM